MDRYYIMYDVDQQKYYWRHRLDEGWTREIRDAERFRTEADIVAFILGRSGSSLLEDFTGKRLMFDEIIEIEQA